MRRNYGGLGFVAFVLFLTFVAIPKNLLSFFIKGSFDHIKAFVKAVIWNVKDAFSTPVKQKVDAQSELSLM
jgi:hypothetical protein